GCTCCVCRYIFSSWYYKSWSGCSPGEFLNGSYPSKNLLTTFPVIRLTASSTRIDAGQVILPTEKTEPRLGVSKTTISPPPLSLLVPLARRWVPGGELTERLSVSWPDAPPGIRSWSEAWPKVSPFFRPVP